MTEVEITGLALRSCDGDEVAFAGLCRRLEPLLASIARDYYAPGLDASDLMQEARIALLAATVAWDPSRVPFVGFASVVVRKRVMSRVRQANAAKHRPLAEASSLDAPIVVGEAWTLGDVLACERARDPHEVLEDRDRLARLAGGLHHVLTPVEATVLARVLNGASLADAGRGVGRSRWPAKTADNAMCRVRRKARSLLEAA